MKSRRTFVLATAATALTSAFALARAQSRQPAATRVPNTTPFDWPTATPETQGVSPTEISSILQAATRVPRLRSFLVVRNGFLIAERYFTGAFASDLLPINSCTKSIASMLVGLALHKGAIKSLDEPLDQLLPEAFAQTPNPAVAKLTLEQVLSGRSGLDYQPLAWRGLATAPDPIRFALSLPTTPASGWIYNDALIYLLAPILARAQGMNLADLAARDLFAPLGIAAFRWERDQNGNALPNAGAALRTRDLIKLAWVMLEGGSWQGTAVLPAAWVAESTRSRILTTWQFRSIRDTAYGYLWFTGTLRGKHAVWALGYGGQFALFVPELRLAIATAADAPPIQEVGAQHNALTLLFGRVVDAAA